jgi:hypothetical protein
VVRGAYLAGLRCNGARGIGRQLLDEYPVLGLWPEAVTRDVPGWRRRVEQSDQDCRPCQVSGTIFLTYGIDQVPRDALAAGPFRNARVREPDRPCCQRCSDAVRAVRPYKDKARAS